MVVLVFGVVPDVSFEPSHISKLTVVSAEVYLVAYLPQ